MNFSAHHRRAEQQLGKARRTPCNLAGRSVEKVTVLSYGRPVTSLQFKPLWLSHSFSRPVMS